MLPQQNESRALSIFSEVIGWGYFLAWSISFYPQVFLNWRRKSVQGLSIDFLCYNILGFVCYSVFNLSFYFSTDVQEEYRRRNNSNNNLVRTNDVVFAVHALLISLFTFSQTLHYKKDSSQHLSKFAKYFIVASILGILCTLFLVLYSEKFMVIDLMYCLSYIKLAVGLIKCVPQAWINFKRQSTVGWSIYNIFLDFTGGTLSALQLIVDAYLSKDWDGILGDPVKIGLGLESIAFDTLFFFQHFVWYRGRVEEDGQQKLIETEEYSVQIYTYI